MVLVHPMCGSITCRATVEQMVQEFMEETSEPEVKRVVNREAQGSTNIRNIRKSNTRTIQKSNIENVQKSNMKDIQESNIKNTPNFNI